MYIPAVPYLQWGSVASGNHWVQRSGNESTIPIHWCRSTYITYHLYWRDNTTSVTVLLLPIPQVTLSPLLVDIPLTQHTWGPSNFPLTQHWTHLESPGSQLGSLQLPPPPQTILDTPGDPPAPNPLTQHWTHLGSLQKQNSIYKKIVKKRSKLNEMTVHGTLGTVCLHTYVLVWQWKMKNFQCNLLNIMMKWQHYITLHEKQSYQLRTCVMIHVNCFSSHTL